MIWMAKKFRVMHYFSGFVTNRDGSVGFGNIEDVDFESSNKLCGLVHWRRW